MAGILNKLMDFIGIEDVDDEGYNEDYSTMSSSLWLRTT